MFNEPIMNKYSISFDSWYTDRKVKIDGLEFQVEIGTAQNNNSPKYLMVDHQTADRLNIPSKANNIAIFDKLDVRKHFRKIDEQRYKGAITTNYNQKDYLDQNRDSILFYKEFLVEEIITSFFITLI